MVNPKIGSGKDARTTMGIQTWLRTQKPIEPSAVISFVDVCRRN